MAKFIPKDGDKPLVGTLTLKKIETAKGPATVVNIIGNVKDLEPSADGVFMIGGFIRTDADKLNLKGKTGEIGKAYLKVSPRTAVRKVVDENEEIEF